MSLGRSRTDRRLPWLATLVMVVLTSGTQAQEDPGNFDVRSASVSLSSGVYYLDAWVEFRLSTDARDALDAGVPLTIHLEVEFIDPRWYWADENVGNLRQSYQLQYHALSERYIVLNLNSGDQSTFATLFSALNYLGRITELPLIDAALLESDREYDVRLRALLSTEDFPGPLRFLAFWRRDWSLRTDWYRWPLEE